MNPTLPEKFMSALAKLVQPDNPEEAATALVAFLPMLTDMPLRAFASRECLNRVATSKRRTIIPSYADIRAAIIGWEREQPRPMAIGGEAAGLDDAGRMWLAYFRKREDEHFRNGDGKPPSSRAHVLSLVKQQSLAAWERITGADTAQAAPRTPEEIAAVRAIVAGIERDTGTKRAAIKIAPKASHSPSVQADAVRAPDPPPTRIFVPVAPGVLAAARAAAGIVAVAPNPNPKPPPIPEPEDEFLDAPFPDEDDLPEGDPLPEDHEFAPRQEEWA